MANHYQIVFEVYKVRIGIERVVSFNSRAIAERYAADQQADGIRERVGDVSTGKLVPESRVTPEMRAACYHAAHYHCEGCGACLQDAASWCDGCAPSEA